MLAVLMECLTLVTPSISLSPHLIQLFEVDVLLMGYVNFLGPRVQDGKFVIPCPKFLILMLGKLSA